MYRPTPLDLLLLSAAARLWLIIVLLAVLLDAEAFAEEVENYLPANTLGYVVAQNLEEASAKIEQLAKPLGYSFPPPLALLKATIRHDRALNDSGSMAIAIMPGTSKSDEMQPFVLIPIDDYAALAQALQADESGEICRVALLGEEVLLAKIGSFAMLANLGNEQTMQRLLDRQVDPELDRETDASMLPRPSADWSNKQDAYLAILPAGLKQIGNWKDGRQKKYIFSEEDLEQSMRLSSSLSSLFGPELRGWFANNAKLVALGLNVEGRGDVRLGTQVALKPTSPLALLKPRMTSEQPARLGLVAERFMLTAGGPLPSGWGRLLADFLVQLERGSADTNGLAKLSEEMWQKKAKANRLLLEDIESCSMVMLPGQQGEPLVGNLIGMITLPQVSSYLESLPQVVEIWNKVNEISTSDIKPESEFATKLVNERIHSEISIDYAAAMRDDNVPALNWMLESAFGPEGKLRLKFLQVDKSRCLIGLATEEQMSAALKRVEDGIAAAPGLEGQSSALNLLDSNASWKALLQPQACLDWAARVENEYLGVLLLNTQEVEYPKMDDSPPMAFSLDYRDERWHVDLAFPAATWQVLGQYLLNYDEVE